MVYSLQMVPFWSNFSTAKAAVVMFRRKKFILSFTPPSASTKANTFKTLFL